MIDERSLPLGWSLRFIPEVAFFQEGPGVRKSQYRENGIKLLNVANINNGEIDLNKTSRYISEEEANGRYNHFLVDDGDLLIGSSGISVERFEGKIAFASRQHLPLCMNTSTIRFKSLDNGLLDINFFHYYLGTWLFKKQLKRLITGSAQLNFGPSHLRKIKIPLPPLLEQKRIADILDKADAIRQKRREVTILHDDLFKSGFRDMFGDLDTNPHNFPSLKIGELSLRISKGESPKWQGFDYQESGVTFITSENVRWGELNVAPAKYIPNEFHNKLKRSQLCENDVLVNLVGASVGRTCKVPKYVLPANVNQAVAVISLNQEILLPSFLLNQLLSDSMQRRLLGNIVESARANISLTNIRETEVIAPSMKYQRHWDDYVKSLDKSKTTLTKIETYSEKLFNALVQRAFKGEL